MSSSWDFFCTHSTDCKRQSIGPMPFLGLCSSGGRPFPLLFCNLCYIWMTLSNMSIGEWLQFLGGKSLIREFFLEVPSMMAFEDEGIKEEFLPRACVKARAACLQNLLTANCDQVDVGSRSIIPVRHPIAPAALASSSTPTVWQVIPRSS